MWLYFRKNPNQAFDLAFDTEIYRQYDEYDRAITEVLEKGDESNFAHTFSFINEIKTPKFKNPIPFKQAVALGQIMQWDARKVLEISGKLGSMYDPSSVAIRLVKAKAWLEIYNPEMMIRLRDTLNTEYVATMPETAKSLIKKFHEFLRDADTSNLSVEKIEEVVYGIPRVDGIAPEDLKKAQRAFFKDVYNLLIGQEAGPTFAYFCLGCG
jgi:lysyl-tRNA synthetase class 1